jgi:hypothetical protein
MCVGISVAENNKRDVRQKAKLNAAKITLWCSQAVLENSKYSERYGKIKYGMIQIKSTH